MVECILLTIDSLRYDSATQANLPDSLSVISEDFTTFSKAYSHGVATPFAFPGIISATHPIENGFIPPDKIRVPQLVSGQSLGFTNNGHLSEERGYSKGFDVFNTSISTEEGARTIVNRLKEIEWIQRSDLIRSIYNKYRDISDSSSGLPSPSTPAREVTSYTKNELVNRDPNFLWSHYMDPHTPYHPEYAVNPPSNIPSSDQLVQIDEKIVSAEYGAEDLSEEELDIAYELYESNIRYLDEHLGELLRWFQNQPWYDDVFIVITSDHGEMFGENGLLFHQWNYDPYDELVHVPLWVKFPESEHRGTRFDHLVGHGDILATIAEIQGTQGSLNNPHIADLRSDSDRHIVSISNNSKRLIEPTGEKIQRRDETSLVNGQISNEGREFLDSVEYPEIITSTGVALGVEDGDYVDGRGGEDGDLDQQLRALGYR